MSYIWQINLRGRDFFRYYKKKVCREKNLCLLKLLAILYFFPYLDPFKAQFYYKITKIISGKKDANLWVIQNSLFY